MASQSLYRKWRSQTFSDLIGQEATTRTLLNAVREGRLAHAYLFCGPRGTGKTSAARLLAKAINCANPVDGEPCNECLSCREITEGRSPDVIEIDAASNTGVDNIRDLRENVNLLGSGGRYKVYVVDECHMLSSAAFNALLKTLEEPPPHVIFVLATTEAHKVLPTIVSRCQRFDFRRFTVRTITSRLQQVAAGEGLEVEPAAADLLARAAQGGMRDALSLLDQAMAYCGARIDLDRTRAMLGLADPGAVRALVEAVAEGRASDALHQLNELVVNGADLRQLQQQLGEEWRALLLSRAGADIAEVMDRTPDEARDLGALASRFSLEELMACARVFARSETPARGLPTPQLALELALLECLTIRRGGGSASQPAIPASQPAQARPSPAPPVTPTHSASPTANPTANPTASAHPASTQPAPTEPEHTAASSRTLELTPPPLPAPARTQGQVEELDLDAVERELDEMFGPDAAGAAIPHAPPAHSPTESRTESRTEPRVGRPAEPAAEPEPEPAAPMVETSVYAAAGGADLLARARGEWAMVKKVCKQQSPSTAALLSHANPVRCDSGAGQGAPPVLVIEAQFEFHFEKLKGQKAREAVEWALEQVLELPMRARFILGGKDGANKAGANKAGANGANGATGAHSGNSSTSNGRSSPAGSALARSESASTVYSARPADSSAGDRANDQANGRADGHVNGATRGMSDGDSQGANGRHGAPNGHANGHANAAAPVSGGTQGKAARGGRKPDPAQLEDEVRADAIVQEAQREMGLNLLDVSPRDEEDGEP